MSIFEPHHKIISDYLACQKDQDRLTTAVHAGESLWPKASKSPLVMAKDTALELGHPKDESVSFLIWRNRPGTVNNGRISLVGPDFDQIKEQQISFGKIVILEVSGFDEENSYDRYQELAQARYDVRLQGYMMRGVSQFQREWSRVSRAAVDNGFSLKTLGSALIEKYLKIDFVISAEVIFVTSCKKDVLDLKPVSEEVMTIIGAMNKMAQEMTHDCGTCEYTEVCSDVEELRAMRKAKLKNKAERE